MSIPEIGTAPVPLGEAQSRSAGNHANGDGAAPMPGTAPSVSAQADSVKL